MFSLKLVASQQQFQAWPAACQFVMNAHPSPCALSWSPAFERARVLPEVFIQNILLALAFL